MALVIMARREFLLSLIELIDSNRLQARSLYTKARVLRLRAMLSNKSKEDED